MTTMMASEFKARCLALLDLVAEGADEITITKHGRPVAKLVPVDHDQPLAGSVSTAAGDDLLSTDADWDADG